MDIKTGGNQEIMQEEIVKEEYEKLKSEVIEFDQEDVITTSGIQLPYAP